jgi:hypothetical protein
MLEMVNREIMKAKRGVFSAQYLAFTLYASPFRIHYSPAAWNPVR